MIKNALIFLCFMVFFNGCIMSQKTQLVDIYGRWKVNKWLILNLTDQSYDEKEAFNIENQKCLNSSFVIDSFFIKNIGDACEFNTCFNWIGINSRITCC